MFITPLQADGNGSNLGRTVSILRVARALRVLRTARIVRVARYMPELMMLDSEEGSHTWIFWGEHKGYKIKRLIEL